MLDLTSLDNPEMEMLRNNKVSGYNYRERRHNDWETNYTLYRDKVVLNRLTQRQSVNIPLMKQVVRTLLKDVDDMPVMYFENLDNDKQAEVFQNEYWKKTGELNKIDLQDIVDKKQVFLYGRSFDQWQIVDGKIKMTVEDPQDILVSRYTDPVELNSSRFLIHTHIFKPLTELESNPQYDQTAIKKIKDFHATNMGLIKATDNQKMLIEKNKKMADMGLSDVDSPVLGETYVELSLHFVYHKEPGETEEQIYLYVEADDMEILLKKKLEEVIGKTKDHYWRNHFPYNSWADDLERQDFWSDGLGDITRTANIVLNSWYSQLVENRTLRNFGMHYYNSQIEGFVPSTFQPTPWGWYGVPGKPSEVLQKIDIPDLSESLDEMNFVLQLIEKATGATATQQGVQTENKITLGEVELALGEAKERIKGMSKFYTPAWKQRATIFLKLIEAASDKLDAVKIYKKGRNTNDYYTREIGPKDWMTELGYTVNIWSQEEKATQDTQKLQKLNAAKMVMMDNPKLAEIYNRKVLEFSELKPEEINDIMEFEKLKQEAILSQSITGVGPTQTAQPAVKQPVQPAMPAQPRA